MGQRIDDIKVTGSNGQLMRNRKKSIRRPGPGKLKIDGGSNAQASDFGYQKQFYSDEHLKQGGGGGNYESYNKYNHDNIEGANNYNQR